MAWLDLEGRVPSCRVSAGRLVAGRVTCCAAGRDMCRAAHRSGRVTVPVGQCARRAHVRKTSHASSPVRRVRLGLAAPGLAGAAEAGLAQTPCPAIPNQTYAPPNRQAHARLISQSVALITHPGRWALAATTHTLPGPPAAPQHPPGPWQGVQGAPPAATLFQALRALRDRGRTRRRPRRGAPRTRWAPGRTEWMVKLAVAARGRRWGQGRWVGGCAMVGLMGSEAIARLRP
jgi:hypothetical protein